jgi:hypothetical protein
VCFVPQPVDHHRHFQLVIGVEDARANVMYAVAAVFDRLNSKSYDTVLLLERAQLLNLVD